MTKKEVDRAIAIKLMGWRLKSSPGGGGGAQYWVTKDDKIAWMEADYSLRTNETWNPTTDMNCAYHVMNRLHDLHYVIDIESGSRKYNVWIRENQLHGRRWTQCGDGLPEAICKAVMELLKDNEGVIKDVSSLDA